MRLFAAVAATAALLFAATGLHPFWPALWFAPVPILLLATRSGSNRAAIGAFAAFLLGGLNLASYLVQVLPVAILVLVLCVPAAVFACAVALFQKLWRGSRYVLAVLGVPAVWCSYELAFLRLSPHGSFGSLAYSQVEASPVIQLAAVTGVIGVSFLVMLTSAAIAASGAKRTVRSAEVSVASVALAAALAYGNLRLVNANPHPRTLTVAAAAFDPVLRYFGSPDPADAEAAVRAYAGPVAEAAKSGAQLIVLPEKFVTTTAANLAAVEANLGQLARENNLMLVTGINLLGRPPRNIAVTFTSAGEIAGRYDKIRMLPGFESQYARGSQPQVLALGRRPFGVAICKDMDFPQDL